MASHHLPGRYFYFDVAHVDELVLKVNGAVKPARCCPPQFHGLLELIRADYLRALKHVFSWPRCIA